MSFAAAGFAMGFLGSAHCVGMCGGIAGALSSMPSARDGSARHVLRSAVTNAGRIASYSAAGAIAGGFGSAFAGLGGEHGLIVLRALAALLIVAAGLYVAGWSSAVVLRVERIGGEAWRRWLAPHASRLRASTSPLAALAFGALWGWLPCGLVYSAVAVAAASGSAIGGATTMLGFGLGTLPATMAVGAFAGSGVAALRSLAARRAAGFAVVAFGVWTFAAAASATMHTPAGEHSCHHVAAPETQARPVATE
jgi:uncharacterized protein